MQTEAAEQAGVDYTACGCKPNLQQQQSTLCYIQNDIKAVCTQFHSKEPVTEFVLKPNFTNGLCAALVFKALWAI